MPLGEFLSNENVKGGYRVATLLELAGGVCHVPRRESLPPPPAACCRSVAHGLPEHLYAASGDESSRRIDCGVDGPRTDHSAGAWRLSDQGCGAPQWRTPCHIHTVSGWLENHSAGPAHLALALPKTRLVGGTRRRSTPACTEADEVAGDSIALGVGEGVCRFCRSLGLSTGPTRGARSTEVSHCG